MMLLMAEHGKSDVQHRHFGAPTGTRFLQVEVVHAAEKQAGGLPQREHFLFQFCQCRRIARSAGSQLVFVHAFRFHAGFPHKNQGAISENALPVQEVLHDVGDAPFARSVNPVAELTAKFPVEIVDLFEADAKGFVERHIINELDVAVEIRRQGQDV